MTWAQRGGRGQGVQKPLSRGRMGGGAPLSPLHVLEGLVYVTSPTSRRDMVPLGPRGPMARRSPPGPTHSTSRLSSCSDWKVTWEVAMVVGHQRHQETLEQSAARCIFSVAGRARTSMAEAVAMQKETTPNAAFIVPSWGARAFGEQK